jgi:anti-sigma factor RsiW
MARCEEMSLLLGPFEDGELEAHEMQEVARHLAGCPACETELAGYRSLAVGLRGASPIPNLAGFSNAVVNRIDELPVPFRRRLRRYMTSFSGGIGATFATGFATAAVAVITAVILTPYFRQGEFLNFRKADQVAQTAPQPPVNAPQNFAKNDATPIISAPASAVIPANAPVVPPDVSQSLASQSLADDDLPGVSGDDLQPVDADDPKTVIDSLEAASPSVAVWNEPKSDTTVIWVPDQHR